MDYVLRSLRGGLNNTDAALALPDDQATIAQNVEWIYSMIAERRKGSAALDLPAALSGHDRVTFLFRDLPTDDETDARLWVFGVTGTASSTLAYKEAAWQTPTLKDAFVLTGNYPNRITAVSLHGKTFFAYKSAVDRLHLFDGSTVRRAGLAEPGAPGLADSSPAGSYSGTRYVRVRVIEKVGSTIVRRSEPSDSVGLTPTGAKDGMVVTLGTLPGEGETHWELELSLDNTNFYVTQTLAIGTTTATDTTAYSTGYTGSTLSEDIGDYALIGSARHLVVDDDRLIWAGSFEDATLASRLGWTPVNGADGDGNDERFETDTDPFKDLDAGEGGGITGLSQPFNGVFLVFKQGQIHQVNRTGERSRAYDTIVLTKNKGAIDGSVVDGEDATGEPCVYFIDPKTGPARIGQGGLVNCGRDIRKTWKALNLNASQLTCASLYYPDKHQVHWWIATGDSDVPDVHIVLHTHLTRLGEDGLRRGWAIWTGGTAVAQCACLFADNIDEATTRSLALAPYIGLAGDGLVHRCDIGDDDNGTEYVAQIRSKPLTPTNAVQAFGIRAGAMSAKAAAGTTVDVSLVRNRGLETVTVSDISLAPVDAETDVFVDLDDLTMSELKVVEIEVSDPAASPGAQWQVDQVTLRAGVEQGA